VTATTVMLRGPLDRRGRTQFALVVVENGRPAGGYQNGSPIDAAMAQALMRNPAWHHTEAVAPIP
jgi:hypothetical protein